MEEIDSYIFRLLMPNIWKAIVIDFFIGKYVRDDVIFNTIQLVSWNPELQPYVAQESWAALKASSNSYSEKQPLTQVTLLDRDLGKSQILPDLHDYTWLFGSLFCATIIRLFKIGMLLVRWRVWLIFVRWCSSKANWWIWRGETTNGTHCYYWRRSCYSISTNFME